MVPLHSLRTSKPCLTLADSVSTATWQGARRREADQTRARVGNVVGQHVHPGWIPKGGGTAVPGWKFFGAIHPADSSQCPRPPDLPRATPLFWQSRLEKRQARGGRSHLLLRTRGDGLSRQAEIASCTHSIELELTCGGRGRAVRGVKVWVVAVVTWPGARGEERQERQARAWKGAAGAARRRRWPCSHRNPPCRSRAFPCPTFFRAPSAPARARGVG